MEKTKAETIGCTDADDECTRERRRIEAAWCKGVEDNTVRCRNGCAGGEAARDGRSTTGGRRHSTLFTFQPLWEPFGGVQS